MTNHIQKELSLFRGIMETLLARINRVLAYYNNERQSLLAQVADLKDQLATALASEKADEATIAQAQSDAAAAKAAADEATATQAKLQATVDADASTEAAIDSVLSPIEATIPADAPAAS
jgi:peptidoglycan hydrolase CwlO-like protein